MGHDSKRIQSALSSFYGRNEFKAYGTKKKRTKNSDPDNPTERVEQTRLATCLDTLGLLWFHVPNEGKRNKIAGAALKRAGLKRGCPDVWIINAPPNYPENVGVVIELKRRKGGTVSKEQKWWLSAVQEHSWRSYVCRGFDECVSVLTDCGYISTSE